MSVRTKEAVVLFAASCIALCHFSWNTLLFLSNMNRIQIKRGHTTLRVMGVSLALTFPVSIKTNVNVNSIILSMLQK